jgi:hypothetical protein
MKNLLSAVAALSGLCTTVHPACAQDWIWLSNAPSVYTFAASANGSKLVAAVAGETAQHTYFGAIYTSTNSGANWALTSAPTNLWTSTRVLSENSNEAYSCGLAVIVVEQPT